jgi:hypothetical protein
MLDDDIWASLQAIPQGERSRFFNEAAANELLRRQREAASARMDVTRATMTPVPGTSEQWIREDRESH